MDGGRLPCAEYVDADILNACFNTSATSVVVTNLLMFELYCCLIHAARISLGSYHGAQLSNFSGSKYPKFGWDMTPLDFVIPRESLFSVPDSTDGKVIRARMTMEAGAGKSSWKT